MRQNFTRIEEAEARNEHLHVEAFEMHHTKKYGALSWDGNSGTAFLMEFDSVQDLADYYGVDPEAWMGIDTVQVGEVVIDGSGSQYMRIW